MAASLGPLAYLVATELDAQSAAPATPPVAATASATPTAAPSESPRHPVTSWRLPILMFHYVRPLPLFNQEGAALSVNPATFDQDLDTLQRDGANTVSFADLASGLLPDRPVILTFDDGYEDSYTTVLPALLARHQKATFFIVSGFVGHPGYLTWDQIREMHRAGMEIGAHTVDHADLSKLSDAKQASQIDQSISDIDNQLDMKVISFAYPSGQYGPLTPQLLGAAGIRYAVTVRGGIATNEDNPLLLSRVRMEQATRLGDVLQTVWP